MIKGSLDSHFPLQLKMPYEGIFTESGVLFHHEVPATLKAQHLERLREYGINIAYNICFTPEEDQRIRKNWRWFSSKHGLKYEDARYYAGFMAKAESIQQQREQNRILVKLGMWPRLCRKLEHRTAKQIQKRIVLLFDPHNVGTADPISTEDVIRIFQMKEQGASNFEISMALKIPYTKVASAYSDKVKGWNKQNLSIEEISLNPEVLNHRVLIRQQYRRFYFAVLRASSLSDVQVRDFLEKDLTSIELQLMDFNWTSIIPQFGNLNEQNLKDSWYMLMSDLRDTYLSHLPQFNGDKVASWISASDEVMPCDNVSVDDIITYLKALRKCIDRNNYILHVSCIDKIRLSKRLAKHGLINVSNFDIRRCTIYHRILSKLRIKDQFIFRHLNFPLTVRDKLKVFIDCYEHIRSSQQRDESDRIKMKLPRIERSLFIDCLIHVIRRIDPEWQPPVLFQKWIRTMRHIDLYSMQSSNSELNNVKRDRRILRQMLFDNTKSCLTGPPHSAVSLFQCPLSDDLDIWESDSEQPNTMLNNIKYSKNFKKKCGKEISEITTDEALVTNSTSLNETRQDLDSYAITKYGTNNLRQITSAYKFEKNGMGINIQHKHGVFEAATSKTIIFGEKSKQLNNNMRIEEPESTTTIQERENSSLINESNASNDMQLSMYSEKNNESLLLTTSEPNMDSLESSNSHEDLRSYFSLMDTNELDVNNSTPSATLSGSTWLDLLS